MDVVRIFTIPGVLFVMVATKSLSVGVASRSKQAVKVSPSVSRVGRDDILTI